MNVWKCRLARLKLVGHWGKSGPGSVNHTGVPEKNLKATAAAAAHPRAIHRPCTLCETQAHCQESPHHSRATAACRLEQPGTKPAVNQKVAKLHLRPDRELTADRWVRVYLNPKVGQLQPSCYPDSATAHTPYHNPTWWRMLNEGAHQPRL